MYRIMLNQVSQRVKGSVGAVRNVFKKKSCGASVGTTETFVITVLRDIVSSLETVH